MRNSQIYCKWNMVVRIFVLVCVTIMISSKNGFAEGSHQDYDSAHGVNRVIRTESNGFYQADGVGNMTINYLPKNGGTYVDKPSFYLGGHMNQTEIDAGLQYEPARTGIPAGWTAFISNNGDYCNPIYRDSNGNNRPWRGGIQKSITSSINFLFFLKSGNEIGAGIGVGALAVDVCGQPSSSCGAFYYNKGNDAGTKPNEDHPIAPWTAAKVATGSNLYSANVKRTTAMTRSPGATSQLDGSQLTCTWSGSHVSRIYLLNGSEFTESGSWKFDPSASGHIIPYMVDQSATGYDSPPNGDPKAKDGQGDYIVDFPSLNISSKDARAYSNESHRATQGGVSRYTTETVNINLEHKGTRGKGKGK